jgi:hypothetical protein
MTWGLQNQQPINSIFALAKTWCSNSDIFSGGWAEIEYTPSTKKALKSRQTFQAFSTLRSIIMVVGSCRLPGSFKRSGLILTSIKRGVVKVEAPTEGAEAPGATESHKEGSRDAMNEKEFLYSPPPAAFEKHGEECRAWHERMIAEYAPSERRVEKVLYKWLRDAGVDRDKMVTYGVEPPPKGYGHYPPALTSDAYSRLFDHGRVIKRRRDGALFVLGEPYASLDRLSSDPRVEAWRALGGEVTCSPDSGWYPQSTVMLLIGEPAQKAPKKGAGK